jgi:hypothetical protein
MARRFDLGRALLIAGGALLIISLFVDWYDTGQSGWEVFETLDLVLFALGAGAIALAVWPDWVPDWRAAALAAAVLFIVAVQLIDAPPAAGDGDPATGIWLALGAGFLMAAGAVLVMASISVTVQLAERERRRRVSAVDRRTAATRAGDADAADAGAAAAGVPSAVPADPDELDRTQPLSALPDDDEPGRVERT